MDLSACATSKVVQIGATSFPFPSASSSVIASVGFVDGEQIGSFWSSATGDSVNETFSGPASISGYNLAVDIPGNFLSVANSLAWDILINGTVVDSFVVKVGGTGIQRSATFGPLIGPSYAVELRVTNVAPSGSISVRYAGIGNHSITLY